MAMTTDRSSTTASGVMRTAACAAAGALALGIAPPARAADAIPNDTTAPVWGNISADHSGNVILVGREAPEGCGNDIAEFSYRHATGHWSALYPLPVYAHSTPVAASGRAGMPLVASYHGATVQAVARRTDARWDPAVTLTRGLTGQVSGLDVAGNADGDFIVTWTMTPAGSATGRTYAAIRQRGGAWRVSLVGGTSVPGPTAAGIDGSGNVTVTRRVQTAGDSVHRLLTRTKSVSGAWAAQRQVSPAGVDVARFSAVVESSGRTSVAYAQPTTQQDPVDAPDPISTGPAAVLRQATIGGSLTKVWSNPATTFPGISSSAGRLRIAWTERAGDTATGHTQTFTGTPGPVTALTIHGELVVGIDSQGRGAVNSHTAMQRVTASGVGAERPLQDSDQVFAPAAPMKPGVAPDGVVYVGVSGRFDLPAGALHESLIYRTTTAQTAAASSARSARPMC